MLVPELPQIAPDLGIGQWSALATDGRFMSSPTAIFLTMTLRISARQFLPKIAMAQVCLSKGAKKTLLVPN
jgi:hypothetical protein